jgi:hypothetical protein
MYKCLYTSEIKKLKEILKYTKLKFYSKVLYILLLEIIKEFKKRCVFVSGTSSIFRFRKVIFNVINSVRNNN